MERIVVCISNPNNAEKLIQRGKILADAFKGECLVLYVLSVQYDELDFNQLQTTLMFEDLAEKYNVKIHAEPSQFKKVSHHIAMFAEQHKATQIVIGQMTQSKLEQVIQESFINSLLEKLEGVDIHIVEVKRTANIEKEYHRGVPAALVKQNGEYQLSFSDDEKEVLQNGLFYQTLSSEFTNGFFVIKKENEHQVLKVVHGKIKDEDVKQLKS